MAGPVDGKAPGQDERQRQRHGWHDRHQKAHGVQRRRRLLDEGAAGSGTEVAGDGQQLADAEDQHAGAELAQEDQVAGVQPLAPLAGPQFVYVDDIGDDGPGDDAHGREAEAGQRRADQQPVLRPRRHKRAYRQHDDHEADADQVGGALVGAPHQGQHGRDTDQRHGQHRDQDDVVEAAVNPDVIDQIAHQHDEDDVTGGEAQQVNERRQPERPIGEHLAEVGHRPQG